MKLTYKQRFAFFLYRQLSRFFKDEMVFKQVFDCTINLHLTSCGWSMVYVKDYGWRWTKRSTERGRLTLTTANALYETLRLPVPTKSKPTPEHETVPST